MAKVGIEADNRYGERNRFATIITADEPQKDD